MRRSASRRSPSAEIRRERTPSPERAVNNTVLCVGATSTASVNAVAASLSDTDKNVFKSDIGNWCVVSPYKDKSLDDVATDLVNAVIIDKNSLPEALFVRAESISSKSIDRNDHTPEAMTEETVVMFHDLARMIIELAQTQ
ncbi:MAG: hypothetical protein EBU84_19035 [Actinobacteria bacterium]|nr:hypothetical protein [Actinomycetota bacterium]